MSHENGRKGTSAFFHVFQVIKQCSRKSFDFPVFNQTRQIVDMA